MTAIYNLMHLRMIGFGLLAVAAASAGVIIALLSSNSGQDAAATLLDGHGHPYNVALKRPDPVGVQEAVNRSDAIVIARATRVEGTFAEGPYDAKPTLGGTDDGVPSALLTHTRYMLEIDQVLLDDGGVRDASVLRLGGTPQTYGPTLGRTYVMFLGRNPDGLSYGIYGDWGLVDYEARGTLRDFQGNAVTFAPEASVAEFVAKINDAVPAKAPYEEPLVRVLK